MSKIKFLKCRDVKSPVRANNTDSGIDFFIPNSLKNLSIKISPTHNAENDYNSLLHGNKELENIKECIYIKPGMGVLIPSGIKTIITPGYDLVFANKSGISLNKSFIVGAQVIDSSYRGEIHLHIINVGNFTQKILLGDKIIQGIIRKVELDNPEEITKEEFEKYSNTNRGDGGFGSTGTI